MIYEVSDYVCQECNELFKSSPYSNCWCERCWMPHMLCPACKAVHNLSAAEQDHYLAQLEA